MSRGSNGLHPVVNFTDRSKCPEHPTKRKWCDGDEARDEAERRSKAVKVPIAAYLCDSCGCYHLTKRVGGDSVTLPDGKFSVGEFRALAPQHPVFSSPPEFEEQPIVPGDFETRLRFAQAFLEHTPEPTSEEMCEALGGCTRDSLRKVMHHLGYHNTRGRSARWRKGPSKAQVEREENEARIATERAEDVQSPHVDPEPPVQIRLRETADVSRETSWLDLDPGRIGHVAVGDLIATYAASGLNIRIQVEVP